MNKDNILNNLQKAKPDHIELIKQGHKLLEGVPQNQLLKPVACDACTYGKWYHEEGYKLVNIPLLKELEELHQDIHTNYTALYYMTFDRRKTARSTLIIDNVEVPVKEKAFRKEKLKKLEKKAITMVRFLGKIEKKVIAMNEKDFESGWFL